MVLNFCQCRPTENLLHAHTDDTQEHTRPWAGIQRVRLGRAPRHPSALADIQTGAQVRHRHERLSRLARKELTYPSEWVMPQAQMRHSQLSDGCSQGKPQC
jgi:hypothetical protein